jgi:hypothetical protein
MESFLFIDNVDERVSLLRRRFIPYLLVYRKVQEMEINNNISIFKQIPL